jgi:chaperonin GroES
VKRLIPLYDRVLVELLPDEQTTEGGLILPDIAKDKKCEGKVVGRGCGRVKEDGHCQALTVSEGDHVLFGKYAGVEVTLNNVKHVILREDEILAYYEEA